MTSINDFATTYMCQSLPFGGVKESGFDRFAGVEGLRGLCVPKAVCEDRRAPLGFFLNAACMRLAPAKAVGKDRHCPVIGNAHACFVGTLPAAVDAACAACMLLRMQPSTGSCNTPPHGHLSRAFTER